MTRRSRQMKRQEQEQQQQQHISTVFMPKNEQYIKTNQLQTNISKINW